MYRTVFLATGAYLPDNVVTNDDLAERMDTSGRLDRAAYGDPQPTARRL